MAKTFRRDEIKAASASQDRLHKKVAAGKITEIDLFFGLVKRHALSVRELAFIRMPIQIEKDGQPNHYSMTSVRNEIRLYNKRHVHNQEIVSLWREATAANGKNIKRALLQIAYGNYANEPMRLTKLRAEGEDAKYKRLEWKKRNGKKVKAAADRLEQRIYS